MKKLFLYFIVLLFIVSLYKDLTLGIGPYEKSSLNYTAVQVLVQQEDSVIAIIKNLNKGEVPNLNNNMIIHDFKILNPEVNPEQLKENTYYFFPLYTQK